MSAREEIIGNARLILGDCREVLPTLGKVDAVVTDPPYGIGRVMKGGKGTGHWTLLADGNPWDMEAPDLGFLFGAADAYVIWGGNYFPLSPSRGWLVWDKLNAVPTMGQCELAWTSQDRPVQRIALPVGRNNYGHPTEKPLALIDWCLGLLPAAETILDPFMGSGTTGVSCAKLGRSFIGIEIEPKYFDIACRRIDGAYKQADMFVAAPPEPVAKQEALL